MTAMTEDDGLTIDDQLAVRDVAWDGWLDAGQSSFSIAELAEASGVSAELLADERVLRSIARYLASEIKLRVIVVHEPYFKTGRPEVSDPARVRRYRDHRRPVGGIRICKTGDAWDQALVEEDKGKRAASIASGIFKLSEMDGGGPALMAALSQSGVERVRLMLTNGNGSNGTK